jgi:hypothetical protein
MTLLNLMRMHRFPFLKLLDLFSVASCQFVDRSLAD